MPTVPTENRRSARIALRIPVKLEIPEPSASASRTILAYVANISRHGLCVDMPVETIFSKDTSVMVFIDGAAPHVPTALQARILWQRNSQCGLAFLKELEDISGLVRDSAPLLELQAPS